MKSSIKLTAMLLAGSAFVATPILAQPRPLPRIPPGMVTGGGNYAPPRQAPQQVRIPARMAQQTRNVNGRQQFLYNGKWWNLIGNDGSTLVGQDGGT